MVYKKLHFISNELFTKLLYIYSIIVNAPIFSGFSLKGEGEKLKMVRKCTQYTPLMSLIGKILSFMTLPPFKPFFHFGLPLPPCANVFISLYIIHAVMIFLFININFMLIKSMLKQTYCICMLKNVLNFR